MRSRTRVGVAAAGAAAGLLAATAVAVAAGSSASADEATPTPSASSPAPGSGSTDSERPHETPLTGSDAEKATAAAKAAVPGGTINRVETDSDGVYEAHVRKSDGTEVVVKMDESFAVTGTEDFQGHGGHGGRGGGSGETPLTGSDAEQATAAAKAAVPGGTIIRVETDSDGVYEAHVRKSDGTEVVVQMDKSFAVTGIEDFQGGGRHGNDEGGDSDGDTTSSAPSTAA